MKTVIRTTFVVFLFLVGFQIPFQRVIPNLSAATSSPPHLAATEQEVTEFFDQYVERYNNRNIEEFLLLFSLRARQNQRDTLPEIRTIYSDLFRRSLSLQLSLEGMKIEIYQNAVEVKARFTANQVLKEGKEKKAWRGDVLWILVREEKKLQILSVDYQYSAPPAVAGEKMPVGEKMPTGEKIPAGEKISVPPPLLAKEEEVKQFFSDYVDRYHQKDIDGFLSFFSPKAVHNQKDGIDGIRGIYTKFFDESRALRYQLEEMKTEIYQNRAEVRARFRVEQTLKKGRGELVWTGNIRWVLGREDGSLKIVSLDYQNDKSP